MHRFFDYCHNNDIKIFYYNTDSILIKEKDMNKMNESISKVYGDLKMKGKYKERGVIISQNYFFYAVYNYCL
jgi:type IV secretory pathway VirB4 component